MRFNSVSKYAVQVQMGTNALKATEACSKFYWNQNKASVTTLVAKGTERGHCGPYLAYVAADGCSHGIRNVTVGCANDNVVEIHKCNRSAPEGKYSCLALRVLTLLHGVM